MSNEASLTAQVKKQQYRNLILIAGVVLLGLGGLYYVLERETPVTPLSPQQDVPSYSNSLAHADPQAVWLEHMQNQIQDSLKQSVGIKQELGVLQQSAQQHKNDNDQLEQLKKQVEVIQKSLEEKKQIKIPENNIFPAGRLFPGVSGTNDVTATAEETVSNQGIEKDELHLKKPIAEVLPDRNADNFVPAGTFAEAIMLGAADVSAGVLNQANPSPMLFRIVANGTLPNQRHSHLKDCIVTAAVVGDISSEKGEIRLERMSCVLANGEIIEQSVEGTVFGMDAKNGVRGRPVWREGVFLERAAAAGILSGLASGVSKKFVTNSVSPLGNTQSVSGGDIFKYSAGQGVSNAMEKLADYQIQRAEQYHPVIQISAGQPVDIVFLKGFYLDGRGASEHQIEPPKAVVYAPLNRTEGLTLSEEELHRIKQHEQEMGLITKGGK